MVFQELQTKLTLDSAGFTSGVENAIGALDNLKTQAGLAAGAIGAIGFGVAVNEAMEFEDALVELEKVSSSEIASQLEDDIRQIATETRLSSDEIAGLAAQASRFGADGPEEIRKFTRVAAEMGAATTLASDEAGRSLAKVSTALGEPLGNARQLGDAINEVSNNFAASSQEIVDSTTRAGATLSELGLSTDEIIGLSGAMNEVAPSSRRAAGMMRRLGEDMLNPENVSVFADALGVTSEEFKEMRDSAPNETLRELAQAAEESDEVMTLFRQELGKRGARAFSRYRQNVDTAAEAQNTANEAIKEGGSLAAENQKDISTLAGRFATLKSELRNSAIASGQVLKPAVGALVGALALLVKGFNDINAATNGYAGALVITAALGFGLVTALGVLSSFMTVTLIPAFKAGLSTLNLFNISLGISATSAAILVGSLLLLGAVIAGLVTNFGGFRDRVVAGFTAMKIGAETFWMGLMNTAKFVINTITGWVEGFINTMIDGFNEVISAYNSVRERIGKDPIEPIEQSDFGTDFEMQNTKEFAQEQRAGLQERLQSNEETADAIFGGIGSGREASLGFGGDGGDGITDKIKQGVKDGMGGSGKSVEERLEEQKEKLDEDIKSSEELLDEMDDDFTGGLPDDVASDVSPEDVMPDTETGGRATTGGTTGTPSAAGMGGAGTGGVSDIGAASDELDVDITFDTSDDAVGEWLRDKIDARVSWKDKRDNRDIRRKGRKV